ncbi:MAG: hypothetical protein QOD75_3457 [Blastocatellia bacterium]|nr:hypothetical protein [Blastocatellia bacterium]
MGVHPGLWIGVLVPPVVWALQMQINYWAVRGACARGGNLRLYSVTSIALFMIILSGICAWIGARQSNNGERVEWGPLVSSSRFMFALGLLDCAVFFMAVMAQGIAAVVIHPCQL